MGTHGVQRRLAAILSADVAGYSRLMGEDEAGTLAALKTHRAEAVDPEIAAHNGRIVKLMGDGALVEFGSVVDAVECAVAIQQAMAIRNADVPEDQRIVFRIGVNLGDIIVEGDDIYGDGVNVAARIQEIADVGGVAISAAAHDQIAGKVEAGFEDAGEQTLKNIAKAVRVYRWAEGGAAPAHETPLALPDKPSIAVLPFDNLGGDPEHDYLADGITEDLITALSKIHWFFVIARNSTFTYKGQAVDVTRVARELGVRYVLEGSVRRGGSRVRITAQLVDATTGNHVWAERYDREIEDIFDLQDEMTQTIVGAVEPELGAAERQRAARKPPSNLDAWETFQRGLWHLWAFTGDDNAEAQRLLRHAQDLDPTFATAYAFESYSHYLDAILGYSDAPGESLAAALAPARRALALDDKDPVAYFALGRVYQMRGEHDAAIAELETALALSPSYAQAHHGLGMALALSGRLAEAAESFDRSMRLSPRDPLMFAVITVRALTCILQGEDEAALDWARKAVREPRTAGGGYFPHAVLAAALANLDRAGEAGAALQTALERKPDLTLAYVKQTMPTKQPDGLAPYLDGLRKAGLAD